MLLELGDAYFLGQRYPAGGAHVPRRAPDRPRQPHGDRAPGHGVARRRRFGARRAGHQGRPRQDARTNQEAHYSMAIIYFSTDRIDEAKAEWVAAAKLDPATAIGRRSQSFVDLLEGTQTAAPADGD